MNVKTIAIMGATGHVGTGLSHLLLGRGLRVRAIGRNAEKLAALKGKGATTYSIDFTDSSALAVAFTGACLVYTMISPGYEADDFGRYQDLVSEAIVAALKRAKVKYVLNLSSLGAHLPEGTGPIAGLHRHEERLATLPDLNVVHLRPTSFMENFYWSTPTIKAEGIIASSLKANLPIAMISTRDIAEIAAKIIEGPEFTGTSVFELLGPEEVTMNSAAKILENAIGKKIRFIELPYKDWEKVMLDAGMKPSAAGLFVEMARAFNERKIAPTQTVSRGHRGKTRLSDFAREFARALQA
ncbi:MAG TPA: NmrA family NAD(P)-binding protein [Nitrospiria bacterium]|nr:NmrA family NAD(P)-binding protein [Nitrospiria bacterium]